MKQRKIDALITPRINNESVDHHPQYSRDYLLSLGTTPPGTQSYDGCGISEQLCTRLASLNILNHSCPFHVPPSPQKLIQNKSKRWKKRGKGRKNVANKVNPIPVLVNCRTEPVMISSPKPKQTNPTNVNNLRRIPRAPISHKRRTRFALWNTRSMKNKTTQVCDLVKNEKLDILAVTDAWLTDEHRDNHVLADIQSTLPNHNIHCAPRLGRPGGGICIIFRKEFVVKERVTWKFKTFECVDLHISSAKSIIFQISHHLSPTSLQKESNHDD